MSERLPEREELLFTDQATDLLGIQSWRLREVAAKLGIERGPLWSRDDVTRVATHLVAVGSEIERESARFALKAMRPPADQPLG